MQYRYAISQENLEYLASGGVIYSRPGQPAFPVRLASEVFQRCVAILRTRGLDGPYHLYDPCCGSGYMTTVLAYLHGPLIARIIVSDIDSEAGALAARNLSLLTEVGLTQRIRQLEELHQRYCKSSHAVALKSARYLLRVQTSGLGRDRLAVQTFVADATVPEEVQSGLGDAQVDLVITDLPYGVLSKWQGRISEKGTAWDPAARLLESLRPSLTPGAVVAIATVKRQAVIHCAFQRLARLSAGKRQIILLTQREGVV